MPKGEPPIEKKVFTHEIFLALVTQPWPNMCNLHWLNAWHMPALSICGCPKGPTMFLQWLLISFPPIRSPSTSPLACLRPMIRMVLLWLWSSNTSLTNLHSCARLWLMSRTKAPICKLVFKLWKSCVLWLS